MISSGRIRTAKRLTLRLTISALLLSCAFAAERPAGVPAGTRKVGFIYGGTLLFEHLKEAVLVRGWVKDESGNYTAAYATDVALAQRFADDLAKGISARFTYLTGNRGSPRDFHITERTSAMFRSSAYLLLALLPPATALAAPDVYLSRDFGAKGDGRTDDTAAFQKALDAAAQAGGGTVQAGRGNFFFAGHLNVPAAVTLAGLWQSVPAHNGLRDRGLPKPTDDGTTFLVTEGAGKEDGPAFLTLNHNSTLKGVVIYYPNQKEDEAPEPYPWAIALRGKNPAVLQVELLNAYNGLDATQNERHLIRDVQGQPLRRGVLVDQIYDIGRIENVHFNPWWSTKPKLFQWQMEHGEAFIFGRADWQYVFNTFCFGYNVGYKFIKTRSGLCNGNFLGLGADDCYTALVVEDSAPFGMLISNGEFVSFHGPDPTMIEVKPSNTGSVRFVNCAFWGPCNQIAKAAGKGTVGFSDCTFVQWDRKNEGRHALQVSGGSVIVRGCEFRAKKPQIELGEEVRRAVVTGNLLAGKTAITNRSKGSVEIANNAAE